MPRIGASYASYYRDASPLRERPPGWKAHCPLWNDDTRPDPAQRLEVAKRTPSAMSARDLAHLARQGGRSVKWTAMRVAKARTVAAAAVTYAAATHAHADARTEENAKLFSSMDPAKLSDEQKLQLLLPAWHRKRSSTMSTAQLKEELDLADTQGARACDTMNMHVERLFALEASLAAAGSTLRAHVAMLTQRLHAKAGLGETQAARTTADDAALDGARRDIADADSVVREAHKACKRAFDAAYAQRTECARAQVLVRTRGSERNAAIDEERLLRCAAHRREAEALRRALRDPPVAPAAPRLGRRDSAVRV